MTRTRRKITIKEINANRAELSRLKYRWYIFIKCQCNFVFVTSNLKESEKIINDLLVKNFGAKIKNSIVTVSSEPALIFDVTVRFEEDGSEAAFIMSKDGLLDTEIKF